MAGIEVRERSDTYRPRYEQYCEVQGLLRERADHDAKVLVEAEDAGAQLLVAYEGQELRGTMRLQCGASTSLGPEMIALFLTGSFAAEFPPSKLAIGSRFIIHPASRRSTLTVRMPE